MKASKNKTVRTEYFVGRIYKHEHRCPACRHKFKCWCEKHKEEELPCENCATLK